MTITVSPNDFKRICQAQGGSWSTLFVQGDLLVSRTFFGFMVVFGESDDGTEFSVRRSGTWTKNYDGNVVIAPDSITTSLAGQTVDLPVVASEEGLYLPKSRPDESAPPKTWEINPEFITAYERVTPFCDEVILNDYPASEIGCTEDHIFATNRIVMARVPIDMALLVKGHEDTLCAIKQKEVADATPSEAEKEITAFKRQFTRKWARLLLRPDIPFQNKPAVWTFVTNASDELYARISQSGVIFYVRLFDARLPALTDKFADKRPLVMTLLPNEVLWLKGLLRSGDANDLFIFENLDGFLGVGRVENCQSGTPKTPPLYYKTNISTSLDERVGITSDTLRRVVSVGGSFTVHYSNEIIRLNGDMAEIIMTTVPSHTWPKRMEPIEFTDIVVRKHGVGDLLCDDQEIAKNNAAKLCCF